MYTLSNGDVLERGCERDPASGAVLSEYEELWRDLPVRRVGGDVDGGRVSVVLRMHDDEHGARGLVVRVRGWCQGILKIKGEITVERWGWVPALGKGDVDVERKPGSVDGPVVVDGSMSGEPSGMEETEDDWERVVRLGERFLPCAVTFQPGLLAVGNVVEAGDMRWEVVENYRW